MKFSLHAFLRLLVFSFLFFQYSGLASQIVINEYSAANLSRDPDDFNKPEDWIELYNKGVNPVSLNGWHLSDDEEDPTQWTIHEDIEIAPGGFMLFW
ncbi:MAG: lamin tail domain-containing protein, partial [Chitinophagaceae bacterium]|nr:lamin tail domain-containing protein [Chitinophagaceae bacterium]